jgi:hypothetical protein
MGKRPSWASEVPFAEQIDWLEVTPWEYLPNGPDPDPCSHIPQLIFKDHKVGRIHFFQCKHCGIRLSKDIKRTIADAIGGATPFDKEVEHRHYEKIHAYWQAWDEKRARHSAVINTIPEGRKVNMEAYLCSEKWKKKREAALIRADHRCVICNSAEALHVHHRTYERLGAELPGDLTVLCGDCHAHFHFKLPKYLSDEAIT